MTGLLPGNLVVFVKQVPCTRCQELAHSCSGVNMFLTSSGADRQPRRNTHLSCFASSSEALIWMDDLCVANSTTGLRFLSALQDAFALST